MALSKYDILGRQDLPTVTVNIPEWEGDLKIKTLTAAEREKWEASCFGDKDKSTGKVRASLAVAVCVDDFGQPLFSAEDVDQLAQKSAKALDRIFDAANGLNGIGKKDVEALAKN